jgi:ribosomal protein S18 acetylase RimI-like enzyme
VVALDPAADAILAARLVELQRAAYAVEAGLIGFDGIPPLHETAAELAAAGLRWLGTGPSGAPEAALAYRRTGEGEVDIDRLVVHPAAFRRGHGRRLVTAMVDSERPRRVTVSTGTANLPARRLYEGLGFRATGERPIAPGVTVTLYELGRF